MIQIINKEECNGCHACFNICPKHCISMAEDIEGFLYPQVNKELCIDCDLCEKVCPELNPIHESKNEQQAAYIVQIKDAKIRKESTSGGAFTAIAQWIIQQNGVVFGATFDENFIVKHSSVENIENLYRFRNSKYVQSTIGKTYKQVKDFLKEGRLVCFSGTPCQIEGLYKYLQERHYENLILVDVVCRAVPSPLLLRKYLQVQQNLLGGNFHRVLFRDKYYGYKYSTLSIYNNDTKRDYHRGVESDPYLRAFFSNLSVRPSCYNCKYKKKYRVSDFTLWDCFNVNDFSRKMDDDKGTTRIITHTPKARLILEEVKSKINIESINVENAICGVREMTESIPYNKRRSDFFDDLDSMQPQAVFQKYFPEDTHVRVERFVRLLSYKLGIYSQMKKIFKLFYKNKSNQKY
ncbi:F420H(2):quinone oxidoreductase [Bacteroidia bacterium]|nr:F420H(2):quinone oxidoreductase [Bacteroidia bacterium]GHT26948.1 F420H(2):quinone oxidoreductase [Bacteroidia bacterium]